MNTFKQRKNLSQAIIPPNPAPEIQHVYRITPTLSNIKLEKELLIKSFKEHVREGKACGPDNILGKELKMIGEIATDGLYHIVEKSITSCKYPTQWKTARVRCAHKKGSTLECGNYCPISLLSIPGKLLESIACKQIDNHLNDNNLISNGQLGFRKGRSTEQLMLSMTEKWKQALDNVKVVGVIFVDFQEAFDSICHEKLSMKLHASGISGKLHEWIMNYLQDRKQYITINGEASESKQIEYGCPPGLLAGTKALWSTCQ